VTAIFKWLTPHDWKRGIAFVILWAYGYQLVAWPLVFWVTTLLTALGGYQVPTPPIVPWEQLFAGTATIATVGGIESWREKNLEDKS